jgi:hypothetical protein
MAAESKLFGRLLDLELWKRDDRLGVWKSFEEDQLRAVLTSRNFDIRGVLPH